jgi:hypothetical protein
VIRLAAALATGLESLHEMNQMVDEQDRLLLALVASGASWPMVADVVTTDERGTRLPATLCQMTLRMLGRLEESMRHSLCTLSPHAEELVRSIAGGTSPTVALSASPAGSKELATHRIFGSMFRFILTR